MPPTPGRKTTQGCDRCADPAAAMAGGASRLLNALFWRESDKSHGPWDLSLSRQNSAFKRRLAPPAIAAAGSAHRSHPCVVFRPGVGGINQAPTLSCGIWGWTLAGTAAEWN